MDILRKKEREREREREKGIKVTKSLTKFTLVRLPGRNQVEVW